MSKFKYSAETINQMISQYKKNGLREVTMLGVHKDLEKLKPEIERFYDEHIFYLDYWVSECGYHGWDWSKDDGFMENMKEITSGITQKFEEIYSLILIGLGKEGMEQNE